ncbi:MAG: helix-turn-helix domain-containing protein [Clostridium sp.]|nr:helix-turn-helix domain-containing protein [Clostridium sp.]
MSNGFTNVNNDVMTSSKLSVGARTLYFILNSYCFGNKTECFPSQKTLSKALGKSVRTVQRYLIELKENGLIAIKNRGYLTNIYTILSKVCINPSVKKLKKKLILLKINILRNKTISIVLNKDNMIIMNWKNNF